MSSETYSEEYFNVSFPSEYVAHVEINRPEKMNAFIPAMWHNLRTIFNRLSYDPAVRAVVLTGGGDRAFTSGLDVAAASQSGILSAGQEKLDAARKAHYNKRHIDEFQACITAVERCEKPVLAVLHGIAFGLAVDLSCACDVRVAAKDVKISVKEVDIGLAADIGTLSRLPKAVGNLSWVKDITLSARVFGADEALRFGFVSDVFGNKAEAVDAVLKKAALIASKSPVAVMGTKEIINYSIDHTVDEGLRYTSVWNGAMLQTQDIPNAMLSGMKKKKPTFEKL